jgi:DNA-binding PadR family transcriptional regulator
VRGEQRVTEHHGLTSTVERDDRVHVPQWNVKRLGRAESTRWPVDERTMVSGLNATAASLLGFLHDGPQSGWDLVATAEREIGGYWSLTPSQVYRELAAMAQAGLIETDELGARDRRAYRLTDDGREAFLGWVRQLPGREQIRYPLLLTMAFARHLTEAELREFIEQHRAIHAARLAEYRQIETQARAAGADDRDLVTLDFGLRYEGAVLDWFDHLPSPKVLRSPARRPPI